MAACHQILILKGCVPGQLQHVQVGLLLGSHVHPSPPVCCSPAPQGHEAGALHAYALPNLSTQQQPGTALGNALDLR